MAAGNKHHILNLLSTGRDTRFRWLGKLREGGKR